MLDLQRKAAPVPVRTHLWAGARTALDLEAKGNPMADGSPNLHDNVTPAPAVSSADAVDAAQAELNELADRFTNSGDLTYAQRAGLVQDLRTAAARVDALKRGPQ